MTDYNNFLMKHICPKGKTPTHTRIGSKDHNIYGGSYIIEGKDLDVFYPLYYDYVFNKGNKEYLTEKQTEDAPLYVDFDFRYCYDVEKRLHTKEHIEKIIICYTDHLKAFFNFKNEDRFKVYVMEKPNVNRLEDKSLTKDGIHILFGLNMPHGLQVKLRELVMKDVPEIWGDLRLTNSWDSVFDEGISNGATNWQLFGSRKPANEAYEISSVFEIEYDATDKEFMFNPVEFEMTFETFKELSSRSDVVRPKFPIATKWDNKLTKETKKTKKTKLIIEDDETDSENSEISENVDKLQELVNMIKIKQKDRVWLKICSHMKYNKMAENDWKYFCERNKLNWDTEKENLWSKYDDKVGNNTDYLEELAKQSNPKEYEKWHQKWNKPPEHDVILNEDIEKVLETSTEYDIAVYFNKLCGKSFKCVDINKKGTYYQFTENKLWELDEGGTPIREILIKCIKYLGII